MTHDELDDPETRLQLLRQRIIGPNNAELTRVRDTLEAAGLTRMVAAELMARVYTAGWKLGLLTNDIYEGVLSDGSRWDASTDNPPGPLGL